MHHPQIYDIVSYVEDFFLLNDSNYGSQIEPRIYSLAKTDDEEPELADFKGLRIIRKLNNGRIEINIFGYWDDNDSMDLQYFCDGDSQPKKVIKFDNRYNKCFNVELTRVAIREIITLDRQYSSVAELPN
jgi:hypothetical protein